MMKWRKNYLTIYYCSSIFEFKLDICWTNLSFYWFSQWTSWYCLSLSIMARKLINFEKANRIVYFKERLTNFLLSPFRRLHCTCAKWSVIIWQSSSVNVLSTIKVWKSMLKYYVLPNIILLWCFSLEVVWKPFIFHLDK